MKRLSYTEVRQTPRPDRDVIDGQYANSSSKFGSERRRGKGMLKGEREERAKLILRAQRDENDG